MSIHSKSYHHLDLQLTNFWRKWIQWGKTRWVLDFFKNWCTIKNYCLGAKKILIHCIIFTHKRLTLMTIEPFKNGTVKFYNVGICKYQHSKFNDLDHALVSKTLQLDKLKRIEWKSTTSSVRFVVGTRRTPAHHHKQNKTQRNFHNEFFVW